jgi:hypothetical protein
MKTSISIASLVVVGSSAAGASALPNPYFGSDTLFNVTRTAITNEEAAAAPFGINIGASTNYVGGGSGGGASAMAKGATNANAAQQTAPMSRMIKTDGNTCTFNGGTKGSADTNASGIVIGLDAVSVLSSNNAGGQFTGTTTSTTCNGNGGGEAKSGSPAGIFQNGTTGNGGANAVETWKWALALIYGGLDLSTCKANGTSCSAQDCNSAARRAIAANWQAVFQNGCTMSSTNGANSGVSASSACSFAGGALWHAFRRDDTSGTADVFSGLLGLSPGTSNSSLNGFGASPYCNALNWDSTASPVSSTTGNRLYPSAYDNTNCAAGGHEQFTGPGGIVDPNSIDGNCTTSGHCQGPGDGTAGPVCVVGGTACADGSTCTADLCHTDGSLACASADACKGIKHRMPPNTNDDSTEPGTCQGSGVACTHNPDNCAAGTGPCNPTGVWGLAPLGISGTQAFDVLPTQMQDNDPIRRSCQGGAVGNAAHVGEEVCNLDGALGLVVPMVDSDWIIGKSFNSGPALTQYPTNKCGGFLAGKSVQILNCAPRGAQHHDGECPNGDSENGAACQVPVDNTTSTSACFNDAASTPTIKVRALPLAHGRVYNLVMRDGTMTSPSIGIAQYPVNSISQNLDFAGAYNRIHATETIVGPGAPGCQYVDMTDQLGCLAAGDPCSIAFAGFEASNWQVRTNGFDPADNPSHGTDTAGFWDSNALQIAGVTPTTSAVQALGTSTEYQFSRKLYFNSLFGFGNVAAEGAGGTAGDTFAADEITLAKYEAIATNIDPILTSFSYFGLGSQSPLGANVPFCEDFNETTICKATTSNVNGCVNNNSVSGIPGETGGSPNTAPTQSTICGDGVVEAFEECDGTAGITAGGGGCSAQCRCNLDFNTSTHHCN